MQGCKLGSNQNVPSSQDMKQPKEVETPQTEKKGSLRKHRKFAWTMAVCPVPGLYFKIDRPQALWQARERGSSYVLEGNSSHHLFFQVCSFEGMQNISQAGGDKLAYSQPGLTFEPCVWKMFQLSWPHPPVCCQSHLCIAPGGGGCSSPNWLFSPCRCELRICVFKKE